MAAMLRKQAVQRLQGILGRLGSTDAASHQALVIPAEVALLVSQRGPGLAVMPPNVVAAIDKAAADSNRKAVKRRGQELTYRLRHMSRTQHRGGMYPNLSQQQAAANEDDDTASAARRRGRGKRRQSRQQAMDQLIQSAALPVNAAARTAGGLAELLAPLREAVSAEEAAQAAAERLAVAARSSIADGGSLYDASAALAYAASRMPACYAALETALGEVAARMPGWRPAGMLDFGAGPATAVWAAQQVWPQQLLDALAVEPAAAMSWLGHEIQQRQQEQYEAALLQVQQASAAAAAALDAPSTGMDKSAEVDLRQQPGTAAGPAEATGREQEEETKGLSTPAPPPLLRWMSRLPRTYRAAQGRQYDLVTAGYVLGELKGDAERRRLVGELWERTAAGGVLLLVEPGTPSGAAHIQKARTQVLEAARWAAQMQQLREQEERAHQEQLQEEQQKGAKPATAAATEPAAAAVAAHVVAPCPHDGGCPLEGRPSWCHFVQRFQRTQLQRSAKATAGIQPRTYQDERYSYVAIAKAPRPAMHQEAVQPMFAGAFMPDFSDPQHNMVMPEGLTPRKVPEDAEPIKLYVESEGEEGEGEAGELSGHNSSEESSSSDSSSSDSGSDSDSSSGSESESESSGSESESDGEVEVGGEEAFGKSFVLPPYMRPQMRAIFSNLDVDVERQQAGGVDEATRRLMLESVLDSGDDDDEEGTSAELAARLQQELAVAAAQWRQPQASTSQAENRGRAAAPVLAPVSEATADLLMAGEAVDWEQQEPAAVAAALAASGGWSRVIRAPRKRKGHVVLDICSAANGHQGQGSGSGGSSGGGGGRGRKHKKQQQEQQHGHQEGVLLRQVVSKTAARRDAGGTAAYRLARRMRWGDLWPQHYQQRFRAEEAPAGQV